MDRRPTFRRAAYRRLRVLPCVFVDDDAFGRGDYRLELYRGEAQPPAKRRHDQPKSEPFGRAEISSVRGLQFAVRVRDR